ncbi:hypothetical protein [Mycobacteroides abscessus]|uniref:hypothetical protein n=1 Tax=Mycobacteroides abscessus TaxID=36809 RepID=UPI000929BA76|nr:hypothetical protein [Mycobacteroides abscessus]SHW53849.1 Uncharacterised protein [Mycobacteroides abscessus subsp. abscessus]SIA40542.1 Uncharacterised protein [Mycobacteroides abscessus subsp. abscessus]SKR77214.1 Uncharacterised protein [Mycobacteroides abscessus subsp. abscessus]
MPELNVERLKAIRNLIKTEPTKHNQGAWAEFLKSDIPALEPDQKFVEVECGTAACVAGWACQLAGDKFLVRGFDLKYMDGDKVYSEFSIDRDGGEHLIYDRASELLGLNSKQADVLFHENWSSKQVLKILKSLIKDGVIPLKYVMKYREWLDGE